MWILRASLQRPWVSLMHARSQELHTLYWFSFWNSAVNFFLLFNIYFTYGSVYMSIYTLPLSHFVPAYPTPSQCPQVHSLVGLSLYSRLAPRFFMTFFFLLRFHIYVLAYSICFSLSDLLHSVWQTLGPSTSLQITQFRFFYGWVIFHCIYVPHLLYPFICRWTLLRLLPCPGYCK